MIGGKNDVTRLFINEKSFVNAEETL
jgi:hypothetical protein